MEERVGDSAPDSTREHCPRLFSSVPAGLRASPSRLVCAYHDRGRLQCGRARLPRGARGIAGRHHVVGHGGPRHAGLAAPARHRRAAPACPGLEVDVRISQLPVLVAAAALDSTQASRRLLVSTMMSSPVRTSALPRRHPRPPWMLALLSVYVFFFLYPSLHPETS
jgi:hypothetical protein